MDYGFHAPTVSFPVAGHADDRADRERVEGRARSLLRRDDRDPRGDPGDRGREDADARTTCSRTRRTPPTAVAADEWKHPYTREQAAFPLPLRAREQVLAGGRAHRQRPRRPQPDLLLPADRGLRRAVVPRGQLVPSEKRRRRAEPPSRIRAGFGGFFMPIVPWETQGVSDEGVGDVWVEARRHRGHRADGECGAGGAGVGFGGEAAGGGGVDRRLRRGDHRGLALREPVAAEREQVRAPAPRRAAAPAGVDVLERAAGRQRRSMARSRRRSRCSS